MSYRHNFLVCICAGACIDSDHELVTMNFEIRPEKALKANPAKTEA